MKKFIKFVIGLFIVIVLIVVALSAASSNSDGDGLLASLTSGFENSAANAALDASGIKEEIESTLYSKADSIAAATGLSTSEVNAAIAGLDISNWEVTTLPSSATETGSYTGTYDGTTATVTTYSDSSYVTVEVSGQEVTFSVPDSAQSYVSYLSY